MKVSYSEFAEIIKAVKGCQFANIVTMTDCKVKKDCPIQGAKKVSRRVMQLNYDYERAVNNHLEKIGESRNFVGGSLQWGTWAVPNKLIQHNGKLYLRAYGVKGATTENLYILANGTKATQGDVDTIKAYAYASGSSAKQAAAGLSEDEQVKPQAISFESIKSVTIGGREYEIVPSDFADAIAAALR